MDRCVVLCANVFWVLKNMKYRHENLSLLFKYGHHQGFFVKLLMTDS